MKNKVIQKSDEKALPCPHCCEEVRIPRNAYLNLECYNPTGSTTVKTLCCGKGVVLSSEMLVSVRLCDDTVREDDWGNNLQFNLNLNLW